MISPPALASTPLPLPVRHPLKNGQNGTLALPPRENPPQDELCLQPAVDTDWIIETPDSRVSPDFLEQVKLGLASIPEMIRNALHEAGWKIKVARFLTEANPGLKNAPPSDKESAGTTADHRSGACIVPDICLAEYVWVNQSTRLATTTSPEKPKYSQSKAFRGVKVVHPPVQSPLGILASHTAAGIHRSVRHEVGHAFDELHSTPSTSADFIKAYKRDLQRMNKQQQEELTYYIQLNDQGQPTVAGKREAFAEAFAILYGGGCHQIEHFQRHFPNTIHFVKTLSSNKDEPVSIWNKMASCFRQPRQPET